jgi:hypothetical protein
MVRNGCVKGYENRVFYGIIEGVLSSAPAGADQGTQPARIDGSFLLTANDLG